MTEAASSTSGASVVRGGMWEIAAQALPQLYVLFSSAFIARYLGAATVGRIAVIAAYSVVATTLLTLGFPSALSRYVAQLLGSGQGGEARWLTARAWVFAGPRALAAFGAISCGTLFLAGPRTAWLLAGVAGAASVVHSVPSALLMGAQRWREARVVGIATGVVAMAAKIAIAVGGGGISDLFAVDACIFVLNVIGTTALSLPLFRSLPPARRDARLRKEFVAFAAVSALGVPLNLVITQRVEVFFLAHFATETDVAHYAVPYSLVVVLLWIPTALSIVFAPAVAALWGAGQVDRIRSGFARALRLSTLLGLTLAGLGAALGASVVELVFGPQFGGLRDVVVVLAVSVPLFPIATLSSAMLRGIGRVKGVTVISLAAVIADLGLAWALVPPFGAIGAAAANTAGQLVWAMPMLVYARRSLGGVQIGLPWLARAAAVVACATGVGLGATLGLSTTPGLVAGAAGFLLIACLAAPVFRPLMPADGAWVEAIAGDRLGRLVRGVLRAATGGHPLESA